MTLGFAAYELAVNLDIQEKLRNEIQRTKEKFNENINYDQLQGMSYLDNFVCEVLRKWPPSPIIERTCTEDITVNVDGLQINFERGIFFYVPVYGFHHDPIYFQNPDKFDPERFNEKNRRLITESSGFMPFGIGKIIL